MEYINKETIKYRNEISSINKNIRVVSSIKDGATKKIKCKCLVCGNEFYVNTNKSINKIYCYKCIDNDNIEYSKMHLVDYLRKKIITWKIDSITYYNGKCDITGEDSETVHHLYSFHSIILEVLSNLNLTLLEDITLYSEEELKDITYNTVKLHYEYGFGVCLIEKMHKLFHKMYGYNNNTEEQYKEFKENMKKSLKIIKNK